MYNLLSDCVLCPRECHVDRISGEIGFCGQTDKVRIARAALHMWEEPCISGEDGSGTVFFSGCSVRCVFCQNYKIAEGMCGAEVSIERLAQIFSELEEKGANNINLVTPTHFVPQIIKALNVAKENGLKIPIVYNTSGYEKTETLKMLDGIVDIYMPDFKYMSVELAKKYSHAGDYAECAKSALAEMVRQIPRAEFDERGIMQKGVIVRHLLLPGCVEDSKVVVKYLYSEYGDSIYISLMSQYTPLKQVERYSEINRKVTQEEYDELVDFAAELGVVNGFVQDGEAASESFIPEFDLEGVE